MQNYEQDLLYLVTIEFNRDMAESKIAELSACFKEDEVISQRGNVLKAVWSVPPEEGSHEIDISLFYFLKAGEYGIHYSQYVDSKEEAIEYVKMENKEISRDTSIQD